MEQRKDERGERGERGEEANLDVAQAEEEQASSTSPQALSLLPLLQCLTD